MYDVAHVWSVSLAGRTTQLGPVGVCPRKGPGWEEGEERGREEGHTHEPTVHPASGPHLESDTASPRAGRGNVRKEKKLEEKTREKSSLCFTDSDGKMRNFLQQSSLEGASLGLGPGFRVKTSKGSVVDFSK